MAVITDTVMIVPTYAEPFWDQASTLDGATFQLTFNYNSRENAYYLDVSDLEGNPIYLGVKVVCNTLLLRKCADSENAPAGDFWVHDTTGTNQTPGLNELAPGSRCILSYVPVDLLP